MWFGFQQPFVGRSNAVQNKERLHRRLYLIILVEFLVCLWFFYILLSFFSFITVVLAISELHRKLVTNISHFAFWDSFAGRFITRWHARAVTRVLMLKRFCRKNDIFQEQSYPDRLSNVRKLCSNGGFLVEEEKYRVTEQN